MKKILLYAVVLLFFCSVAYAVTNDANVSFSFDIAGDPSTPFVDDSGNNKAGSVKNGYHSTTNKKLGAGAYYTNNGGYVNTSIQDIFNNQKEFTICFWVNATTWGEDYVFGIGADATHEVGLQVSGGLFYWLVYDGSSTYCSETPPSSYVWNHICITYDGDGGSSQGRSVMWINGVAQTWNTCSGSYPASLSASYTSNFHIGTQFDDSDQFDGAIDQFMVYSRNLTVSEIAELYNSGTGFNPYAGGGAPLSGVWVNITRPYPEEHLNGAVYVNVTSNQTVTCSINNTDYSLHFNNDTFYSWNNSNHIEGYYSIFVNCTNSTGGQPGNDTVNFYIDKTAPVITPYTDLLNNNTIVWNGTLNTYINFSDNLEIYSINVTLYNGTIIFNRSNIGATFFKLNISQAVGSAPNGSLTARVCDTHTAQDIKALDIEIGRRGLIYVIEEAWTGINTKYIHVYPEQYTFYNSPKTNKLRDRYTFQFNKKTNTAGTEVFIIESSHYIDIIKNSKYGGHVVIPELGYWVDLESGGGVGYNVKRITNNKIEVRISGLIGSSFLFNSIGELNCVSNTYYYSNLNPAVGHTPRIIEGTTNNYYLNVTRSNFITSLNSTLAFNGVESFGGTSENWTIPRTAPEINTVLYKNYSINFLLGANGKTYNLTNLLKQQSIYNQIINNCSNASINATALNVTFWNLTNNTQAPVSVVLTVEGDLNYYNSFNTAGFELCLWPDFAQYSESITIAYGIGSQINYYNFDTTLTNITQYLKLYIEDNPSSTTFTIKDKETSSLLESVYATMYRLINGTWEVIEAKYSDITGRVKFSYQENIKYKFFLSKSEYVSKVFYLDPILYTDYEILMDRNISLNTSQDYDRVALVYYPKLFYNNQTNNFTFMISSPFGELINYGYTLTYPSGSVTNSGTASIGEELNSIFHINGTAPGEQLTLYYYYNSIPAGHRNFTYYYDIVIKDGTNITMISLRGNTYGLGIFERVLIAVLIVVFVVGIASLVGQPLPGLFIAIGVYIYLVFIGFIPLWTVLITIAFALIILGSRPEG